VAAACRLGAAAGGADDALQDRFARFGSLCGVVAQLANDITALASTAGKTDRVLCRPTLPLVYAAHAGTPTAELDQPAQELHDSAGAFAWAVAAAYRSLAIELIPELTADRARQADLVHLLHPL
jgi:geranylgeranyl pyrophosphate synthase